MHLSGAPRRRPAHFSNHTPRPYEVQDPSTPRPLSTMFGPTGVAGPALVSCTAQTKSEIPANDSGISGASVKSSNLTSSRKDIKSQEESRPPSSQVSVQENANGPFLDKMMTQTNLLVLPPSNPSYQMAYFLKTTGPIEEAPKAGRHRRISSAMRLFKSSNRRPSESLTAAHQSVLAENDVHGAQLSDPEPKLPGGVVQKVSTTGKKYFQIEPTSTAESTSLPDAPSLSPDILESNVSVIVDERNSTDSLHNWVLAFGGHPYEKATIESGTTKPAKTTAAKCSVRILDVQDSTPIRPQATAPATPVPDCGGEFVTIDTEELHDKIAPLRSHPISTDIPCKLKPLAVANKAPPYIVDPKPPQIAHPSPQRFGSHSLLLQRTASDSTGLRPLRTSTVEGGRSVSDNCESGLLSPRVSLKETSHLLLVDDSMGERRGHDAVQNHERMKNLQEDQLQKDEAAMTALPQFRKDDVQDSYLEIGPSRHATAIANNDIFNVSKFRSKYSKQDKSHSTAHAPSRPNTQPDTPRRRLRRPRPDGPRSQDLAKIQSQAGEGPFSEASCTGQPPMRRTPPMVDMTENVRPVPKPHTSSPRVAYVRRPTNAFLRGRRSPAVRSRSSKVVRTQARSTHKASRPNSPTKSMERPETPTLPLPLPRREMSVQLVKREVPLSPLNRELPSPPAKRELPSRPEIDTSKTGQSSHSATSMNGALARAYSTKALPSTPVYQQGHTFEFPSPPSSAKKAPTTRAMPSDRGELPPASARDAAYAAPLKDDAVTSRLEARLAAIERRNKLLEAALMAVLKTSGTLNGCPCGSDSPTSSEYHGHHHKAQCSIGSRLSSESAERDVLDVFMETKVKY